MSSQITRTMDRINAIASANTLFTGAPTWHGGVRVLQGYSRFTDTDDFDQFVASLATNGSQAFFSFWASRFINTLLDVAPAVIRGELLFNLDAETTQNLDPFLDAASGFVAALQTDTSYMVGETCPERIEWEFIGVDVAAKKGQVIFDFGNRNPANGIFFPDP